ncbi:MAG: hypothetical protein ABIR96_12795 [Bdellovibrionota bacterium]
MLRHPLFSFSLRLFFLALVLLTPLELRAEKLDFEKCLSGLSKVLRRTMKGWGVGNDVYFVAESTAKSPPSQVFYLSKGKFYRYNIAPETYLAASNKQDASGSYFVTLRRPSGDGAPLLTDFKLQSGERGVNWSEGEGLESKLDFMGFGFDMLRKQKDLPQLLSELASSADMAQSIVAEMREILPKTSFVDPEEIPESQMLELLHNEISKSIPLLSSQMYGPSQRREIPAMFENCRKLETRFSDLGVLLDQAQRSLEARAVPRQVPQLKNMNETSAIPSREH